VIRTEKKAFLDRYDNIFDNYAICYHGYMIRVIKGKHYYNLVTGL